MATIAAQCCNGWGFGLQHQIRVGLSLECRRKRLKAFSCSLSFTPAFPATVFALTQAQRVINEQQIWQDEDREPLQADWLASVEEKLERGRRLRGGNWGLDADAALENSLARQLAPETAALVDAYNYGEAWARGDLTPKEADGVHPGGPHVPGTP